MLIATAVIRLYAPWVHSLKEKRMETRSLLSKLRNRLHLSAAEVDAWDVHQTIVLGIAAVAANSSLGDKVIDQAIALIEENTEAEITGISREIK